MISNIFKIRATCLICVAIFVSVHAYAQFNVKRSMFSSVFEELELKQSAISFKIIPYSSETAVIEIKDQKDFDNISQLIQAQIDKGENDLLIKLPAGRFYFKENHLSLHDIHRKNVILRIIGNGTEIISAGEYLTPKDFVEGKLSTDAIYLNENLHDYNIWSEMFQVDQTIEILDRVSKKCRLHCKDFFLSGNIDVSNSYLQLTEWYMSGTYKIYQVDGNYIYFIASDLSEGIAPYGNFNVNYDYTVAHKFPRFRVCHLPVPTCPSMASFVGKGQKKYKCNSSCFLDVYGCDFKQVVLKGLKLIGNCTGNKLINMHGARTSDGFIIQECVFTAVKSIAVYILETPNVSIKKCNFEDCYDYGILGVGNATKNTSVIECFFVNIGKGLKDTGAIVCLSDNFYIANNRIVNYGIMGIGVGFGYGSSKEGYGIVERNELLFTDEYYKMASRNSLIDGGAIYLYTRHKGTIVRYNRIHRYTGAGANRGIYCDDGAYGFAVYGNIITEVENSNYIDSRKVKFSYLPSNTNNVIMYNIIAGNYKFEGNDMNNNGCVKGENIILYKNDLEHTYDVILNNVDDVEEDCWLSYKSTRDLSIIVPQNTRRELKMLPFYKNVKQYFRVR